MTSIDALKIFPLRLGIARVRLGWRLLLSITVMGVYMVVSRIIFHADSLSRAEIELLRTPFRLGAGVLFWLLMADVIFRSSPDMRPLQRPGFIFGIFIALLVPLFITVEGVAGSDALVVAITSFPVALNEEFFFRGIVQTLLIRRFGAFFGIGLAAGLFVLFHVGVVQSDDTTGYLFLVALAGVILGLVYFKTGSMAAVVTIHTLYDALACVFEAPLIWGPWDSILLIFSVVLLLQWVATRNHDQPPVNL